MEEIDNDPTEKSTKTNQVDLRPRVVKPDTTLGRYMIDEFKTKAIGSKEVPFEKIDLDLYKPKAKLTGFKTSEQRISYWIQAFIIRYVDYLNEQQEYKTTWEEIESISHPGKPDKVKVTICCNEEKLFVASVFVTTGRIQVQGQYYDRWSSTEFPLFLRLVNYLQEKNLNPTQNDEFIALSSQGLFYTNCTETDESNEEDDDDCSDDDSIEQENEETSDDEECKGKDKDVDKIVSNSLITNALAQLELNFTQTKLNLENELKSMQDSLEKVLFMDDRLVRFENNYKAYTGSFDDKFHQTELHVDGLNNKMNDLLNQVKKLQDQRSCLLSKQSEMKDEIESLKNENSGLKKEIFVLREIVQKHENALERSLPEPHPPGSATFIPSSLEEKQPQSISSESATQSTTNQSRNQSTSNQSTKKSNPTIQSTTSQSKPKDPPLLLIDSNGKFLDPALLYPDNPAEIKRTYTLRQLKDTINEHTSNPTSIVIHCGTNDLEKTHPESVIHQIKKLLATAKERFPSSRIIYSSLLPRQDILQHEVEKVNHELYNYCNAHNIAFISHVHIQKPSQFFDNKHLNHHGVKFFAKNVKSALFGTLTKQSKHQRQSFDGLLPSNQPILPLKEQSQVQRPQQPSLQQHRQQTQLPNGRPSYASVTSLPSPRGPVLASDPAMDSGLPNPLRTLIRQLQMFI